MSTKRIVAIGAAAIAGIAVAVFSWIWFAPCALGGCAPLDQLAEYQAEGSALLDMNGEPFARLATVNRRIVSIDSLPPHVPQAFVAIEDQRFYDHGGVDFFRTAGALLSNLRSGQVEEGGSTITQQLARNLFPEWLPYTQRNIRRKVLEARVARQIERTFSKDKILELYINHIYLGSGAYGVDAAAQTYFGKPAAELNLMEAATIAGLPQSPSQVNPHEDLERSTRRRNLVLDQMVEAGYVEAAEAAEAKEQPIVVAESAGESKGPESTYFVERVRRELEERVGARFYTAGLQIHTTLDPVAQQAAEDELTRQLSAIESGRFGTYRHATYESTQDADGEGAQTAYLQGAVVVLDARSGEVRALVGGRDFDDSKFDRATQALRQPGSAFKPFVYAAALERYRTPAHVVEDSPVRLTLSDGQIWEPENYTGSYDGEITMREAITRSKNAATVRLAQDVGIRSAVGMARDLGITTEIHDTPATALGAAEVRPIELVAAYAAFGNGGHRVEPHLITRVVDRTGQVLWEASPSSANVLDPAVAFVMTTMLQDVVDRGTGSAVRAVGFGAPAAGKTGTTNDASDVWFVGYTPELAAGVWIGLDQPATIVRGASGGTLAAPVWGRMMRQIYAGRTAPEGWRAPSGVTTAEVDRATGAAVSPACPPQGPVYTEYFIRSSPPQQYCPDLDRSIYSYDDSLWIDEEWSETEYENLPGNEAGIDWPELEALRRRIERAQDDLRDRMIIGDSLGRRLPGEATDAGGAAAGSPGAGQPGAPGAGQPSNAGGGQPGPAQPGGQPPAAQPGGQPPAAQPQPSQPPQDRAPPSADDDDDDGPALLGTPVGQ